MDTDDFDAFVTATSGRMLLMARLITGSPERAEDLIQDAYAGLFRRWDALAGQDPLNYVRRSITNGNIDWWRRRSWRERPTEQLPEPPAAADPYRALVERGRLEQALRRLTRRERAVVVLRYLEDRSEAEAAELLGVARGTVKSTAARALDKLRNSPEFEGEVPR